MLNYLYLLLALLLIGCGAKPIHNDPSEPTTDANYLSAEFSACGQVFNGIGICEIQKGKDLSDLNLKVQGYFDGAITMAATCAVDERLPSKIRYQKSARYDVPLSGRATETCVFTVLVSPEYPDEQNQPVDISSLKGHLFIKVVDAAGVSFSKSLKVKEGYNPSEIFSVKAEGREAEVIMKEATCGVDFKKTYPIVDGKFVVKVKDFLPYVPMKTCPISGVFFVDNRPTRMTVFVNGYSRTFIPLAIPLVSLDGKELTIQAENAVAAVGVGSSMVVSNTAKFTIDPTKSYIIRAVTVRGRSIIGIFRKGKTTWIQ
jgi:hypothetical protein